MGLNHIDVRLGVQCNYGVLGPLFWDPHSGGPQIRGTPGSGVWGLGPQTPDPRYPFGGITGHSFLVTCDPTEWVTRILGHSPYGLCSA